MNRTELKIRTYANIAKNIGDLSVSSRLRVGSLAIKKDLSKIAAIGYNGSTPGALINHTTETEEESLEPGESGFVHAESNLCGKFNEPDPHNYIVILTHSPCSVCSKLLVNVGFRQVYWIEAYRDTAHLERIFGGNEVQYGTIETLIERYPRIKESYESVQRFLSGNN